MLSHQPPHHPQLPAKAVVAAAGEETVGPAAAWAARPGQRGYPHPLRLLPQIIHCLNCTTPHPPPHPPPPPQELVRLGRVWERWAEQGRGGGRYGWGGEISTKEPQLTPKIEEKNIYIYIKKI